MFSFIWSIGFHHIITLIWLNIVDLNNKKMCLKQEVFLWDFLIILYMCYSVREIFYRQNIQFILIKMPLLNLRISLVPLSLHRSRVQAGIPRAP